VASSATPIASTTSRCVISASASARSITKAICRRARSVSTWLAGLAFQNSPSTQKDQSFDASR